MHADLPGAMRARDRDLVAVLRSTLAAIANAEAVDAGGSRPQAGLNTNEVARRHLDDVEIAAIVIAERDRLLGLSAQMQDLGQHDESARLRVQATALDRYLAHHG